MIDVEHLFFRYRARSDWVLQDVSFKIDHGAALIGPNGSGKTTLLRVLTGFVRPKRGQVYLNGERVKKTQGLVGKVGYVPTNPLNMLTGPTVEKDIQKATKLSGRTTTEILSLFQLEELKHKKIYTLSHGQQKLLSLASAYATDPEILLLDEPSIGLDREKRRILLKVTKQMEKDGTVFVATNDLRVATTLSNTLVLVDGRLVSKGDTRTVLYELKEEWAVLPNEIVTFVKDLRGTGVDLDQPVRPDELAQKLAERF